MIIEYSDDGVTWVVVHDAPLDRQAVSNSDLRGIFLAFNAEPPPTFWQNFFGQYEA